MNISLNNRDLEIKDRDSLTIRELFEIKKFTFPHIIVKVNNKLVGFVALHIHTITLAEIRSLVVQSEYRNYGLGKKLIKYAIEEAKQLNIKEILVLTYQDKLFKKFNFQVIDKELIPNPEIWADCIKCIHFPKCDEIALKLLI